MRLFSKFGNQHRKNSFLLHYQNSIADKKSDRLDVFKTGLKICTIAIVMAVALILFSGINETHAQTASLADLRGVWSIGGVQDPEDTNPSGSGVYILLIQQGASVIGKYYDPNTGGLIFQDCGSAQSDTLILQSVLGTNGVLQGLLRNCEFSTQLYDDEFYALQISPNQNFAQGFWVDISGGNAQIPFSMVRLTGPIPGTGPGPGTGGGGPPGGGGGPGTPSDFTLACDNPAVIAPGETGQSGCAVASINGFNQQIDLTCSAPAGSGITCGLSPNAVTPPSNSQIGTGLVVSADVNTKPGEYTLNILATSGSQSHTITVPVKIGQYTINVQPSKTEVNPYPNGNANPPFYNIMQPIALSATKPDGTSPAAGLQIEVKACTQKGSAPSLGASDADGHAHDAGSNPPDPCFQSSRPHSALCFDTTHCTNPITVTTDSNGQAKIYYLSPHSTTTDKKGNYYYISGLDKILATKADNPAASRQNDAQIRTAVPDLEAMFDSVTANCPAAPNTYGGTIQDFEPFPGVVVHYQLDKFESQGSHGCLFYGTPQTKDGIMWIASAFTAAQIECFKQPAHACRTITINGQPKTILNDMNLPQAITVKAQTVPVKISAMSLPWGGLSDIDRDWEPPHKSHNDGKEVDFGFSDYLIAPGVYDRNLIVLLRFICTQAPGFGSFPSNEGGNILSTLQSPPPHIHVDFKQ